MDPDRSRLAGRLHWSYGLAYGRDSFVLAGVARRPVEGL